MIDHVNATYMDHLGTADPCQCATCRCGAVVAVDEGTCPDCRAEDDADERGDEARERAWDEEDAFVFLHTEEDV